MTDSSHSDVLILGGGVIGMACAYYLALEGVKVRIIEQDQIGTGASSGNCGLVFTSDLVPLCAPGAVSFELMRMLTGKSPLYIKPEFDINKIVWLMKFAAQCRKKYLQHSMIAKEAILRYSAELYDQLFSNAQIDAEYEKKGSLMVCRTKDGMVQYAGTSDLLKPYGFAATPYRGQALTALEPALREDLYGAWHHPGDAHLKPQKLMTDWRDQLQQLGVIFEEDCLVDHLPGNFRNAGRVVTSKGEFTADNTIVCLGAWSPKLAGCLGDHIPVLPGKGYTLTMKRPEISPKIPCYMVETNVVATPWKEDYRLGGTMEFSGYSTALNPGRINRITAAAVQYLKTPIGSPLLEERSDLRPMTVDDLPIIGRVSSLDNFYIATGHGMLGITMATGTGKVIADMVQGKNPEIDITPFSPQRF